MLISVKDAAGRLGVSERRVRAMIEDGGIRGQKVGGRWLVEAGDAAFRVKALPIKPLSERASWLLIDSLSDRSMQAEPVERHRLKDRLGRLFLSEDPVPLLKAWLRRRARRVEMHINPADLADFRNDRRIMLSGVSHPDSGLLAGNEAEAYVSDSAAAAVMNDFLLVEPQPDSPANVVLHIYDRDIGLDFSEVPRLALAADLAERAGVRELAAARSLARRAIADSTP
ncbi:helix-turn-helix domain-containing protein [Arthrobacter sp. M4]|uniref:helix-turn-helix domain-containing protein n=1 Tax=Arthrobacter sp. M4 TaxID=218160 RepID=UPI001CDD5183|nr:helix-turn-helix domain-containing protein [Arthrobacter sp. M4]MCA4134857.1 helix-turn-helix domain-containing protein [Arthrobacter sp. M4]